MKLGDIMIVVDLDDFPVLRHVDFEQGDTLKGMAEKICDAVSGDDYVGRRVWKDNPELIRELKEALKVVREARKEIATTLRPFLRRLEKAADRAEDDITEEDAGE